MKKAGVLLATILFLSIFPTLTLAQDLPESTGQIAFIGTDLNVYTMLMTSGGKPTALTDDAVVTQTSGLVYEWPTWSTDGQLAYFRSAVDRATGITLDVVVSPDGTMPGMVAYSGANEVFTYANWSPQNCADDCRDLALLLNDASGLLVKLVRWQDGEGSTTTVGRGSPFYYSWSGDGSRMLLQRNNQQFEIYDAGENRIADTLASIPGAMFAPAWSPVDDRLLLGVRNETNTDLVVADGETSSTLVSGQANPVWFSWSPDGSQVAYIDRAGPVLVLDAASGEVVARSPTAGVLAFFWSPDGNHIAYVTLAAPEPGSFNAYAPSGAKVLAQAQQPTGIAWSVLDVADGANRRYGSFLPTNNLVYLLTYFDQFAQSHHLWSPDSRQLVYSEVTPDGRPVISLLDTTQAISVPLVIADGVIGIWSFS